MSQNNFNIIEKIKKIQAIINDKSTTDGERDASRVLLEKLMQKYNVDINNNNTDEEKFYEIKCADKYEKDLLIRILQSYKIIPFHKKNHSNNLILFKTNLALFEIIKAELNYHSMVLNKYLKSVTINYMHKFVLPYQIPENIKDREVDPITEEASFAASLIFAGKNYSAKKMIDSNI